MPCRSPPTARSTAGPCRLRRPQGWAPQPPMSRRAPRRSRPPPAPGRRAPRPRATPPRGGGGRGAAAAEEPPGTEGQKTVAGIWSAVLQAERVGLHDNFFELGGTSLALVEVRSRLRETLGCEVSLVDLFRSPTVDSLASLLGNVAEARVSLEEVEDRGRQQGDALRQGTSAVQRRREFLTERRPRKGGQRRPPPRAGPARP